jgi:hypothetical protein
LPNDGEQHFRDPIIIFPTKVRELYIYEKNPCLFRGRHVAPFPGDGG